MKRTFLDEVFDRRLQKCIDNLFYINQLAIKEEQPDIKSQSCYLIEILETVLSNREIQSSKPKANEND